MPSHPLIRPGDRKKEVVRAKVLARRHLARMGNLAAAKRVGIGPTYGPGAVEGVKMIQKKHKLSVDGIIGPNTWNVLELMANKPWPPKTTITWKPISRSTWGARPPKSREKTNWTSTTTTYVHHTVTAQPKGDTLKELVLAERAHMRYLQQIGFDRGFADISYSYIIFPSGRVYEGRGFEVMGAHTLGHNSDVGVAFVGNFENQKPTKEALAALEKLRKHIRVTGGRKRAHCSVYATSCPGKNLRAALNLSC